MSSRVPRGAEQIFATADAASDATFTELAVLARLEREGPATSAELAGGERVSPQATGTVLAMLARFRPMGALFSTTLSSWR